MASGRGAGKSGAGGMAAAAPLSMFCTLLEPDGRSQLRRGTNLASYVANLSFAICAEGVCMNASVGGGGVEAERNASAAASRSEVTRASSEDKCAARSSAPRNLHSSSLTLRPKAPITV